ncbi:unnamed protein product [Rhizoctonia solani]|uniref:DUF6534 domain-containing protein n=1 Tax=Rhizoctonia solani TaxID=456999 RepID=A0A8H2XL04_9AGAM|nr:unnamed protein product [Rhizoctonia solani]
MDLGRLTPEELEELAKMTLSPNKPLNFGPFILGALFDAVLCGIFLMQCGAYISSRNKDNRVIKTLVAWGTTSAWIWIWDLFVSNFGTYHSFFSTTYLMKSNQVLAAVMIVLAIAACAGGVGAKIIFIRYDNIVYANKLKVPAYICLSCTLAVDLIITGIILQYLMRKRTINKHTNHLMSQLTRVTFESQLPPTLIAIALFCVFTAKNDSFISVPLIMMQCKLYGISLLHTLNVRESLTGSREGTGVTPEGCAITSGALQQFDLERLTFANPGLTTVIDALPGHARNSKAGLPQPTLAQEDGAKLWQLNTDNEGSRSILTDDRMDYHDVPFKANLA